MLRALAGRGGAVGRPLTGLLTRVATMLAYGAVVVLLGWTAVRQPIIDIALMYVVVFWTVAWHRPEVALMLIFASAPFQNDISGGGPARFSIAEVNMALTVPVMLVRRSLDRHPVALGPVAIPVFSYFAVCVYSSLANGHGGDVLVPLFQMFLYLVVAVVVFSSLVDREEDLLLPLKGAVGIGVFLSLACLVLRTNYFLGLNKNGAGASLSCALLIGFELWLAADTPRRRGWFLAAMTVTAAGLIFTLSRGAWLGALAGILVITAVRRRFLLLLRLLLILAPLAAVCWQFMPSESKTYATNFDQNNWNIHQRFESIDIARRFFEQSPIYGVGIGLRKQYDATNLFWFTLAETGVLGLVAFLSIHLTFFRMIWSGRRLIRPHEMPFSLLAVGGALVLDQLVHGMVDHYWSRGAITMAWASAGMATRAYGAALRRGDQGRIA